MTLEHPADQQRPDPGRGQRPPDPRADRRAPAHRVRQGRAAARARARRSSAMDHVLSLRFEAGAVVVQTARPDAFYAPADRAGGVRGRSARSTRSPRPTTTCRPCSPYLVKMSMAETAPVPRRMALPGTSSSSPAHLRPVAAARCCGRAGRLHGAGRRRPVLIALSPARRRLLSAPALAEVNGARVPGAGASSGLMIWMFYLRFIVPVLAVFYGTALIADEVEDKTITYLFTRPIRARGGAAREVPGLPGLHRAGRAAVGDAGLLPHRADRGGSIAASFLDLAEGPRHPASAWRSTGRCSRSSAPGSSARC